MDLDEQRPELPHRAAGRRGCVRASHASPRSRRPSRRRAQRSTRSRRAPAPARREVRRDAPLVGRRLHRADQQRLRSSCVRRSRWPSRHASGTWRTPAGRALPRGDPRTAARSGARSRRRRRGAGTSRRGAACRRTRGSGDRPRRDRPDRARTGSPGRRVAQLRARGAGAQHVALVGVQREARSDQSRLVGVDDPAGRVPDLHADDPLAEHALVDDAVDRVERRRIAVEEAGLDRRLHDPLPGECGANCRASRSASSCARLRAEHGRVPHTASTTSPARANWATGRLICARLGPGPIVAATACPAPS